MTSPRQKSRARLPKSRFMQLFAPGRHLGRGRCKATTQRRCCGRPTGWTPKWRTSSAATWRAPPDSFRPAPTREGRAPGTTLVAAASIASSALKPEQTKASWELGPARRLARRRARCWRAPWGLSGKSTTLRRTCWWWLSARSPSTSFKASSSKPSHHPKLRLLLPRPSAMNISARIPRRPINPRSRAESARGLPGSNPSHQAAANRIFPAVRKILRRRLRSWWLRAPPPPPPPPLRLWETQLAPS
mmetsp:Transcript_30600/g.68633  ORF Transcript_30600/g.68633 Transcript_30600/m.68633 type:complete len:246 (+) Transcript_30600:207-944(+)